MTDTTPVTASSDATGSKPAADTWERLRGIIDGLADGIVIVDSSGSIRFANPAAGQLFNRSAEQLVGTMLGIPLVAGETTEMEIVRRGGGNVVHAELRVVETTWEGEHAELVSLRDITDRKVADERTSQLAHEREARLQAESASRTKSDFLAIMSHELRTPLNAILGYSELIELGIQGDIDKGMHEQIVRIRLSAKHLLGLVNDILDLAKVEAGRLSIGNAPANVLEAVTSAITLIEPTAVTRNLKIVVTKAIAGLPDYVGDPERVTQVLVNLLSNAVKCTEPGGTLTIDGICTTTVDPKARLEQRNAYVKLSVQDTGSGIAPDKLTAIFEPFVQVDSGPTRSRDGSGIGLTIAQRLSRAMGGDLTVESTIGKGSTFHLWIPADADAAPHFDGSPSSNVEPRAVRPRNRPVELEGLGRVAQEILVQLEPTVSAIVARIRSDDAIPMAPGLRTSQVTDHLSTLIADIAGALIVFEEVCGEPSPLLADAMEIQRLVSDRHGAQRARLGWSEAAFRREFMIIREELERVVLSAIPAEGPLEPPNAIAALNRFLDQSEFVGVRRVQKEQER